MRNIVSLLTIILMAAVSMAHEGHNNVPGKTSALADKAPAGVVQSTSQLFLKLVTKSDGIAIYPFDHDEKPIPAKDVSIVGSMTLPKKGKSDLKFTVEGDAVVAKVSAKGAHRYTIDLSVVYAGKQEKAKFNVEPQ